jgi:hypothetical protein
MMPFEYIVRRVDDDWFDIPYDRLGEVFRPARTPSTPVEGSNGFRILVEGEQVSFSDEETGIVVRFETGDIDMCRADEIAEEIRQNIEAVTGQPARLIGIT